MANAVLRIEGGDRDGTELRALGSVNMNGPLKPGFYIEPVNPFAFSDFPYYFGRKAGTKEREPKVYAAKGKLFWLAAAEEVQAYLDEWANGGTVVVVEHNGVKGA